MSSVAAVDRAADRVAIDRALAALSADVPAALPPRVADAIRYGLLGGGKRLRGLLLLSAYRAAGGREDASALAAALEVVHANEDCGKIVAELMRASGAGGMIGGQLLDLEGEGRPLDLAELERIHRAKTGALIRASLTLGGMAARATPSQIEALARFGDAIGLAFQIADDVLDVTATTDRLGKPAGRDLDLRKSTYPAVLGVAGATARANALVADGCAVLRAAGLLSTELDVLARFVIERES